MVPGTQPAGASIEYPVIVVKRLFAASIRICVASVLIAAPAACGGSGNRAQNPDDRPGETLAGVVEALAEKVDTDGGASCDDFAALLREWVDRERDALERLVADLDRRADEMTEDELAGLDERLTVALEIVVHRASECQDHAGARRALSEFDAAIDGS